MFLYFILPSKTSKVLTNLYQLSITSFLDPKFLKDVNIEKEINSTIEVCRYQISL